MSPPISDLVRESKLETQLHPDFVQHIYFVAGRTPKQRRVRKDERWIRESYLGRGAFGVVHLEKCIQGDAQNRLRAVKELRKVASHTYHRELEAIALFSYPKYERCFVKSFGWYEDEHSIFITMEYLPAGDLHQYLKSPLPEEEGKHIVSQILEGLDFMHSNYFTHRDLKPANILVVCKGPEWWVKLADFGISKRATEEHVSLRTQVGTPAFMAPEILGFVPSRNISVVSYTNAVDIWSIGIITFLILTGETLFKDLGQLHQYVMGTLKFPDQMLSANNVSRQGRLFVKGLVEATPQRRPSVKESLQDPWLDGLSEEALHENERTTKLPSSHPGPSYYAGSEPSASWSSTKENDSSYQQQHPVTVQGVKLNDLQEEVNHLSLKPITTDINPGKGKESLLSAQNLVRCDPESFLETSKARNPTKRRLVKIPCPGQNCDSRQACGWICSGCHIPIDYGFSDQYFYCDCGRALYNEYDFKCNSSKHGSAFERFKQADLLELLQKLPAYNELNMLILGPIASGKSTFINAFISYLRSQTFGEAVNSDVFQWAAPCSFLLQTISGEGEIQETRISNDSIGKNHDNRPGGPETKHTTIYTITRGMTRYRLIDTPGIGSLEAREQDDQNIADVVSTLRDYDDLALDGVLLLLKPNISRVSIHFRAYMEKLLSLLHRDSTDNVVFGFSHTRDANVPYTPGDTSASLKTLLSDYPGIGISLEQRNSYCFDSETFRFLAARNYGVMMANEDYFHKSWTHSRREVWRMLHHFKSRPPLLTASIDALNETRKLCSHMDKPIMEVAQVLQTLELTRERKSQELQEKETKLSKLLPNLNAYKTALRTIPSHQPRLVCANQQCVIYKDDGTGSGTMLADYKACQVPCYLVDVPIGLANPSVMTCAVFEGKEYCKVCQHHWSDHLHVLVELEQYSTIIKDRDVEKAMVTEVGNKRVIESAITLLQTAIDSHRSELDQMLKAVARINLWLSEGSIVSAGDTFLTYSDGLIGEEQVKVRRGSSDEKLLVFEHVRCQYTDMVASLARDVNNFNFRPSERERMMQGLFEMEHFGKSLENILRPVLRTHHCPATDEGKNRERVYRVDSSSNRRPH